MVYCIVCVMRPAKYLGLRQSPSSLNPALVSGERLDIVKYFLCFCKSKSVSCMLYSIRCYHQVCSVVTCDVFIINLVIDGHAPVFCLTAASV